MNDKPKNPFSSLDDFLQNSPFQMMKLMLPFLPAANQKTFLILIKFMEFKYTLDFFRKGNKLDICSMSDENASPMDKIAAMKDFLPPKEQESIDNMLNMMSAMELFQGMSEDGDFPFPFSMEACENEPSDSDAPEEAEPSKSTSQEFECPETSPPEPEPSSLMSCDHNHMPKPSVETEENKQASEDDKPKTISICSNIDF